MRRFVKWALIVLAILLLLGFCTAVIDGKPDATPAGAAVKPNAQFEGTWASTDGRFTATIENNSIVIMWYLDDETQGLYWKGTFPSDDTDGIIISIGDRVVLNSSLVASQDPTKKFTYHDEELSYDFTSMGVTKQVHLTR